MSLRIILEEDRQSRRGLKEGDGKGIKVLLPKGVNNRLSCGYQSKSPVLAVEYGGGKTIHEEKKKIKGWIGAVTRGKERGGASR